MNIRKIVSLILRVTAALIMLQTLYFKFTAQPESIYIFSKVGMEPWGRIGTGVAELIAAVLLLVPSTIVIGALLACGIMLGAIASHLLILGIEVQGDGGLLFTYALVVLISSVVVIAMNMEQVATYKTLLLKKRNA